MNLFAREHPYANIFISNLGICKNLVSVGVGQQLRGFQCCTRLLLK